MKTAGMFLTAIGGIVAFAAIALMSTAAPYSDVINIGLLQQQELVFAGGCTLFLGGIVLWAAGLIEDALHRIFRRIGPLATTGMIEDAGEVRLPAHPDAPPGRRLVEPDDDRWPIWKVLMFPLAVGLAMIVAISIFGNKAKPDAAAIENAADMLADNMEMAADNLDAMN